MTATTDATDRSIVTKLAQAVKDLQETVETQADQINNLEETINKQNERIEQLEDQPQDKCIEIQSEDDTTGLMDIWIAGVPLGPILQKTTKRIDNAYNRIDEMEKTQPTNKGTEVDTEQTGSQESETPLERICYLPEHVVDRELTANQKRARFIAKDVRDYAKKVPAGLMIDSRTVKKVIAAAEETKPHTQTVARVMEFLADLGKGDVELKKRRGKKFVVVDPEVADRYHSRCDRRNGETPGEGVIGTV